MTGKICKEPVIALYSFFWNDQENHETPFRTDRLGRDLNHELYNMQLYQNIWFLLQKLNYYYYYYYVNLFY